MIMGFFNDLLYRIDRTEHIRHMCNRDKFCPFRKKIAERVHAQAVPHLKVDVQELDAEFYVFSGHKVYGPTGIGVLYGKEEWLDKLPPYQGGGEMIASVSFEKTTFNELPFKFEAGTPDYIGSTALAEALLYVGRLGMDTIAAYEDELLRYATDKLNAIDGMRIFGQAAHKGRYSLSW